MADFMLPVELTRLAQRVVDENRTLWTASGVLADWFAPYAVHIYKVRLVDVK